MFHIFITDFAIVQHYVDGDLESGKIQLYPVDIKYGTYDYVWEI